MFKESRKWLEKGAVQNFFKDLLEFANQTHFPGREMFEQDFLTRYWKLYSLGEVPEKEKIWIKILTSLYYLERLSLEEKDKIKNISPFAKCIITTLLQVGYTPSNLNDFCSSRLSTELQKMGREGEDLFQEWAFVFPEPQIFKVIKMKF